MAKQQNVAVPVAPALPAAPVPLGTFVGSLGDRCLRAFLEWLAHSVLLFAIFAVIQAFHWGLTNLLGVPEDKMLFGRVPMSFLFDGADVALLVGLGLVGVTAAVRAYLGKHGV
jgi:hypothetical protein